MRTPEEIERDGYGLSKEGLIRLAVKEAVEEASQHLVEFYAEAPYQFMRDIAKRHADVVRDHFKKAGY